jgi:hypothetical protein
MHITVALHIPISGTHTHTNTHLYTHRKKNNTNRETDTHKYYISLDTFYGIHVRKRRK